MIARGLRRLAFFFAVLGGAVVLLACVIAFATGTSIPRALSLGFMFAGAALFVAGAAVGLRGPARMTRRPDGGVTGFTLDPPGERIEAINASYLLVGSGIVFVLLGIVLDPYARLF